MKNSTCYLFILSEYVIENLTCHFEWHTNAEENGILPIVETNQDCCYKIYKEKYIYINISLLYECHPGTEFTDYGI